MSDFEFAKATEGMTAEDVLNYYRNLYHAEPLSTERGIIANALNDILPRMAAPPVTIGQPVWDLCKWPHRDAEIRAGKVSMLQQKADKSWKIRISVNSAVYDITIDEIGKSVFLTKEAAEQALKGEKHEL